MNSYRKKYDVIINGASFLGIVWALKYKLMNKSVLLINEYGFVGGSITESLNCFQKIYNFRDASITGNLVSEIFKEKDSLFFREENYILFNPEVVKYTLQKQLEKSDVDLLFHVLPLEIKHQNEKIYELTLFGKEGKITFAGEIYIEASNNYQLLSLIPCFNKRIREVNYNLFVSSKLELPDTVISEAQKFVRLYDGRYWANFKINFDDELSIENQSQKFVREFEEKLRPLDARTQILPTQSYISYNIECSQNSPTNFIWLNTLSKTKYTEEDELIMAHEMESKI